MAACQPAPETVGVPAFPHGDGDGEERHAEGPDIREQVRGVCEGASGGNVSTRRRRNKGAVCPVELRSWVEQWGKQRTAGCRQSRDAARPTSAPDMTARLPAHHPPKNSTCFLACSESVRQGISGEKAGDAVITGTARRPRRWKRRSTHKHKREAEADADEQRPDRLRESSGASTSETHQTRSTGAPQTAHFLQRNAPSASAGPTNFPPPKSGIPREPRRCDCFELRAGAPQRHPLPRAGRGTRHGSHSESCLKKRTAGDQ